MYHILRLYSKPHRTPWLSCSHRWGTSQYWRHSAASLSSKLHLGLGIDGKLLQDVKLQHRTKINYSASLVPLDFSNHRLIGLLSSNILGNLEQIWEVKSGCEDVVMLLSSVWANPNCGHFIAWWLTGILWFTDCWVLPEFLWTQCLQSTPETRTSSHSEPGATRRFAHLINPSYGGAPSLEIILKSFSWLSGRYCEGRKKEQLEIITLRVLCMSGTGENMHCNTEAADDFAQLLYSG